MFTAPGDLVFCSFVFERHVSPSDTSFAFQGMASVCHYSFTHANFSDVHGAVFLKRCRTGRPEELELCAFVLSRVT